MIQAFHNPVAMASITIPRFLVNQLILPLLRKLYLKKHDSCNVVANNGICYKNNNCSEDSKGSGHQTNQTMGILVQKVEAYIEKTTEHNSEQF